MTVAEAEARNRAISVIGSSCLTGALAVMAGAILLAWPAFYNGFPLLYPDSMTYLEDGRIVARAVFLHHFSGYYGMRSLFYSLGILPFHWNMNPWPIVALQCLLVAWVVWLVVRSIATRRPVRSYLILVLLLGILTSASWYAAFVMPDILGPVAYLCLYLLVYARQTLSRAERLGLYAIAWWGVTAHATHLMLAAGLCVLMAAFTAFEREPFLSRMRMVGEAAAIVGLAAASQLALNGYLYGKPSLNGERPPYLTARIIADGPGLSFLETHCGRLEWATCGHLRELSGDSDNFLWGPDGLYETGADSLKRRIESEEIPFVLATMRAYPRQQFAQSSANFERQLMAFGLYGFDPSEWIRGDFDHALPKSRSSYLASRQARDALPLDLFTAIQWWTLAASVGVVALATPFLWRRHSPQLAGLSLVVVSMVVGNAFVTGTLSVVDDRYGCRVMWLVPLLAGVFVFEWLGERGRATAVDVVFEGRRHNARLPQPER
jgi:hypothetical protein